MKIFKSIAIISVALSFCSIGLHAKLSSAVSGSSTKTGRQQTQSSHTSQVAASPEKLSSAPSTEPSVAHAVAILTSYDQARSDFIKALENAKQAYNIIAKTNDPKIKQVAAKLRPVLDSDEKIIKGIQAQGALTSTESMTAKKLFEKQANEVSNKVWNEKTNRLLKKDEKALIDSARAYLNVNKNGSRYIENILKEALRDKIADQVLLNKYVMELMLKIKAQFSQSVAHVQGSYKARVDQLAEVLDDEWNSESDIPSNKWFGQVFDLLKDVSRDSSQQVSVVLELVREVIMQKYLLLGRSEQEGKEVTTFYVNWVKKTFEEMQAAEQRKQQQDQDDFGYF